MLEYLVDLNLRAATARAGLGKTPASAGVIARKMRDKPAVAEAIAKLMQERHGLQASRIVSELGAFSYSRLTDYMEVKDGQLTIKDSASWREEMKSAVSEIRETRDPETGGSILRLKLHDKIGALDRLGKSIGLFKEKSESTVRHTVEVVDPLARIKARLASLPRATVDGADVGKGPMEKREYEAYGLAVVESEIHGPLKLAGAHALNSRPHAQAKFKRQPGRGALARKQIRHCVRASVRDCRRRSISRDRSIRRNASQVGEPFHALRVTAATMAALRHGHASPR